MRIISIACGLENPTLLFSQKHLLHLLRPNAVKLISCCYRLRFTVYGLRVTVYSLQFTDNRLQISAAL